MNKSRPVLQPSLLTSEALTLHRKTKTELIQEILEMRKKSADKETSYNRGLRDHRTDGNRLALEAWRLLQYQEEAIRRLARERDVTMDFLSSRLLLVESRLRQEQKNIEELISQKERLIEEQRCQIQCLQKMLSISSPQSNQAVSMDRKEHRQSRRKLSRRFSLALEECGGGRLSRASPCYASSEDGYDTGNDASSSLCPRNQESRRARSMSELRCSDTGEDSPSRYWHCHESAIDPSRSWIKEAPNCTESDESSRHSDSLDSGISAAESDDFELRVDGRTDRCSQSMQTKQLGLGFLVPERRPKNEYEHDYEDESRDGRLNVPPPVEKHEVAERGFSRCFGTNHRSVTKPRDVKYRKLWKIRRVMSNVS